MTAAAGDRPVTGRELGAVGAATFAVTVAYVLVAAAHGAFGASRNDDWAYLRVAFRFGETGAFSLDGWTQMVFVGQAVLAWPVVKLVGPSIEAMQLLVAGLGWIGVMACYLVLRTFVDRVAATLAVAVLMLGPMFGTLATSFMTDVPAFCFQMLTLLFATRILRAGWSTPMFAAMCAVGVAATSIREYGLVVFAVCVAAVGGYRLPAGRRRVFVTGVVASGTVVAVMMLWRSGLPNGLTDRMETNWVLGWDHAVSGLRVSTRAILTMAVLVAPVAVLTVSRGLAARMAAAPARTALVLAGWIVIGWSSSMQWVGNYVRASGSYVPLVQGSPPAVVPPGLDTVVRWLGYGVLLILLLDVALPRTAGVRWPRLLGPGRTPFSSLHGPAAAACTVVAAALGLTGAHLVLLLTTDAPFFDRYLLLAVPVVVAVAAARSPFRGRGLTTARAGLVVSAVAVLSLLGARFVEASAALDGTTWRFADRIVDAGEAPETVDAGFAWFGFHQRGPVDPRADPDRVWWAAFFPGTPVCVTVSVDAEPVASGPSPVPPATGRSVFGTRYYVSADPGPSDC